MGWCRAASLRRLLLLLLELSRARGNSTVATARTLHDSWDPFKRHAVSSLVFEEPKDDLVDCLQPPCLPVKSLSFTCNCSCCCLQEHVPR